MADMPSNARPPSRPTPPSSRGRRETPQASPRRNAPQNSRPEAEAGAREYGAIEHEDEEDYGGTYFGNGRAGSGNHNGMDDDDGEFLDYEELDASDEELDYYAILNVPANASPERIRTAYHSLSLRFHPDKQPPELRDRATEHFNNILVAYETLNNPNKRALYDKFGVKGLKEQTWQVGVRTMSPEEFKLWLKENMEKGRMAELDELVNSRGRGVVKLDVSGLIYDQIVVQEQDDQGNILKERLITLPPCKLVSFMVKHSFQVPLESVGALLETPLPTLFGETKERPKVSGGTVPQLRFDLSMGAAPQTITVRKQPITRFYGNPGFALTLHHVFPSLPADTPRSIASLLGGHEFQTTVGILPYQTITTQVSRAFGRNALTTRATFVSLPTQSLPAIELQFNRRLGLRHSFFTGLNTGSTPLPISLASLLHLPKPGQIRQGLVSIGYTYHPSVTPPTSTSAPNRSKQTESYTVIASTGFMVSGAQLRASYSRTIFACTPLGGAQRRTTKRPHDVGLKLTAEATLHITGAAAWTLKATRKAFTHTALSIAVSVGGASGSEGVLLSLTWSRLGQSLSLPIALTPVPDRRVLLYAITAPILSYFATELLLLRPLERRVRKRAAAEYREARKMRVARRRAEAEAAVELLRAVVVKKVAAERKRGGLVVEKATWGGVDVTVPLQSMVDNSQVTIPRGVDKSRLLGFYDACPGEEKTLVVRYRFAGEMHEAVVKGKGGFVAPLKRDLVRD